MIERIKILLVEDEPIISDDLAMTLEELGYNVVATAFSGEEAIEKLKNNKIDLALVDIMIDGEIDGVEVGKYIDQNVGIPFIYLTSLSDKLTLERVKHTSPYGYLVKPIDERELAVNIELAISKYASDLIQNQTHYPDEFFVRDKGKIVKVSATEVLYLEASDNYCIVHTEQKQYVLSQTLKKAQSSFDPKVFCRIHKSYHINTDKISHIEGSTVAVGDAKIPIGRVYKEEFLKRIQIL